MNKIKLTASLGIAVAVTIGGAAVAVPAYAASTGCSPTGASITTSSSRIVGTGTAKCAFTNIPEYMNVRVWHYYGALPDALAFFNQTKKPSGSLTWSGSTKRCDNGTTAEYYSQAELGQYSGTKVNSARKRITACAGTGS